MATILLTGSNGYIGRRLLPILALQGHKVICVVRDKRRISLEVRNVTTNEILEADLLKPETLVDLPVEIDYVFYLVHSMSNSYDDFEQMEIDSATNFIHALQRTRARQIIYLSGISNHETLSPHLRSRKAVEKVLGSSSIALTVLRAAIIIGSGSASFEIIRDIVEVLPLMITPLWVRTKCQPIAIRNVIDYLTGVIGLEKTYNRTFDIGGDDILTYKEMLFRYAKIRGMKRGIITLPVLTPRLSSLWLFLVTSTSFSLARNLVESMEYEVVVEKTGIRELVPLRMISYNEAVELAFQKIDQNLVVSSWKDSFSQSSAQINILDYIQVPDKGVFTDKRFREIKQISPEMVLDNIWRIGGDHGWDYLNSLWKLRGFMDKLVGGVGLRRGRTRPDQLLPGDALDFWRVLLADKKEKRLLLYAEMKLPGEAWLEFKIVNLNGRLNLEQTATFRPIGLAGRLYWYSVLPFHGFIFNGMANKLTSDLSLLNASRTIEPAS